MIWIPAFAGMTEAVMGQTPATLMETHLESMNFPTVFFADAMLSKLARWLRMLGYDTTYERSVNDADIGNRVLREDRWLLTRDRYLVERKILQGPFTLVHSNDVADQLDQLQYENRINLLIDEDTVCRCAACNHLLGMITPQEAASRVPPFVAGQYKKFTSCPDCNRVYWPGTHWNHLPKQLQHLRFNRQM